ncbi:MAG: response regulator [Desulfobacteraceae bacterium]|jgi:CheY-like chemotaxis protein
MKPDETIMQPGGSDQGISKQIRILVVEDVANVATVLKTRLESYNYEICDIANTGRKAIDCALHHKPDLILMDIILEGDMNGIEAAEIISDKLDVPIIYLSCLNDQKVFDRAIKTNPYGYILKPYDSSELRFSIENAIRIHRLDKKHKARIAELEKRCVDTDPST